MRHYFNGGRTLHSYAEAGSVGESSENANIRLFGISEKGGVEEGVEVGAMVLSLGSSDIAASYVGSVVYMSELVGLCMAVEEVLCGVEANLMANVRAGFCGWEAGGP